MGIPDSPHLFDEKGSFTGPAAKALVKTFYYLFHTFNVTIISYSTKDFQCEKADCSKMTRIIELGIDFDVGLFYLPSLPANVTQGPVRAQFLCYLTSRPPLSMSTSSHRFTDSFEQANTETWIAIVFFWLAFVLISILRTDIGIIKTLWYLFGAFLRNFIRISPGRSSRAILFITIASFFLIQTIFLTFIRVGMVQNIQFEKIETMADVEKKNMRILAFDYLPCHQIVRWFEAKRPIDPIPVTLIDIQAMSAKIDQFAFPEVLISGRGEYEMIQEVICLFSLEHHFHYHSIVPAFRIPGPSFLSTATPIAVRERLSKYTYWSFETGNTNKISIQSPDVVRDLAGKGASTKCLAGLTEPTSDLMTFSPLKVRFFKEVFFFFVGMILLSGLILILESFLFKPRE